MKKKLLTIAVIVIIGLIPLILSYEKKPDWSGMTVRVASSQDLSGGSYAEGAAKFTEEYGCTVEFTDDFENCDLIYSSGEDFSLCRPIDDYINPKSKLYTREIIRQSCMRDGKIYGITHVLLGNLNYCAYSPSQFGEARLPYDYYKDNDWTWDSFIDMTDQINANIAVDWTESYVNMRYSLFRDENGSSVFDYGTQEQIEWLNFVRTLIYDDGITDNTEGAFKVDFLPQLILSSVDNDEQLRYIPWPTKTGKLGEMFVDEYHFCVPKAAQNPKLSVELANYMIKACIDTRTALYQANMTDEDWRLFKKQLKKIYTYPPHTDYVPASRFIEDFIHGKTVTEHIYNVENDAGHIN